MWVLRLMLTSIFSAGNTYTYAAVRTLYGLALEGRAPGIFKKCSRNGIPIYAFFFVMVFPALSFLQCSSSSSIVITWFVNLVTAGGMFLRIVCSLVLGLTLMLQA
jgi:yeast amino acid transporter